MTFENTYPQAEADGPELMLPLLQAGQKQASLVLIAVIPNTP